MMTKEKVRLSFSSPSSSKGKKRSLVEKKTPDSTSKKVAKSTLVISAEDLLCVICREIVCGPAKCSPCGHIMCYVCTYKSLHHQACEDATAFGFAPSKRCCPIDRKTISSISWDPLTDKKALVYMQQTNTLDKGEKAKWHEMRQLSTQIAAACADRGINQDPRRITGKTTTLTIQATPKICVNGGRIKCLHCLRHMKASEEYLYVQSCKQSDPADAYAEVPPNRGFPGCPAPSYFHIPCLRERLLQECGKKDLLGKFAIFSFVIDNEEGTKPIVSNAAAQPGRGFYLKLKIELGGEGVDFPWWVLQSSCIGTFMTEHQQLPPPQKKRAFDVIVIDGSSDEE